MKTTSFASRMCANGSSATKNERKKDDASKCPAPSCMRMGVRAEISDDWLSGNASMPDLLGRAATAERFVQ